MAVKNPNKIIQEVQNVIAQWEDIALKFQIPGAVQLAISKDFLLLII
jgi:hypothetical protein